jgi:Glycosyltransferase family 87
MTTDRISESHPPISVNIVILAVLVLVRLYRYPAFFFPRDPTFFDRLPDWIHLVLGRPSNALVNNPISLGLVTTITGLLIGILLVDFFTGVTGSIHWYRLKVVLIGLILIGTVVIPVSWEMLCRAQTKPHLHAHDGGVIQTEEAIRMVLSGRNPYRETYHDTSMRAYARDDLDPPLFHWPYLPFYLAAGIPFFTLSHSLFHWFDMRVMYIVFYFLSIGLLWYNIRDRDNRLGAVILFGLNPFLVPFLVEGRNDIVPLTLIMTAVFAAGKGKDRTAVFFTALACCTKQFAWLFIPFIAVYLKCFQRKGFWKRRLKLAPWFILPVILLIVPFLIWDFHAFWDDIIAFNAGNTEVNYLIGGTPGYGAANYLLTWGIVATRMQYYPFWIWQCLGGIPLFFFIIRRVQKHPNVPTVMTGYALVLLVLVFLSRLTHDNYLGFISGLIITGIYSNRIDIPAVDPEINPPTDPIPS